MDEDQLELDEEDLEDFEGLGASDESGDMEDSEAEASDSEEAGPSSSEEDEGAPGLWRGHVHDACCWS